MSIFNTESPSPEKTTQVEEPKVESGVSTPESQAEPFADLLGTVLNEKGEPKYASVPEALKGLSHSQEHIKTLETELSQYKLEIEKRASVENALKEFTQKSEEPEAQQPKGLDEEAIAALLDQRLSQIEQQKAVKSNTEKVVQAIQQKYGDKAEETFYGKAKELGMTGEDFNSLAAKSPDLVLALFNTQAQQKTYNPSSSVNTAAFTDKTDEVPTIMDAGEERISLQRGEKSVLIGASNRDLMDEMARHKAAVYKKYNLTP